MSIAKQKVAKYVVNRLPESGIIALGSGSTVNCVIKEIKKRNLKLKIVCGSSGTSNALTKAKITEINLSSAYQMGIDLCIDGADEIYPDEEVLLKGHGGALVREKIIWNAANTVFTIVDESKLTDTINKPIPVEIVPFALPTIFDELQKIGDEVKLRPSSSSTIPFITDNGNYIIDLTVTKEVDLIQIHQQIKNLIGVVDTGIFGPPLTDKNTIFVGYEDKVVEL